MPDLDVTGVESALTATAPRPWGRYSALALAGAVALLFVALAVGGPRWKLPLVLSISLPWCLVACLALVSWRYGRRLRDFRETLSAAWDHAQLEQWGDAAARINGLLTRPIRAPSDRAQVFLIWAAVAEHQGRYECAGVIYDALVEQRIGDPLQLHQANLLRVSTRLRTGELTDAVDLLSRIERLPMPDSFRAACDLTRLFQQVLMGHLDDAVRDLEQRRAHFREHLSTRAAYAYGLFAAALHGLGRAADAARLWLDATTLVRPPRLVREFDLLSPVAGAYPSAEFPL